MSTETSSPSCRPEIWGGIESTINRVNGTYCDQLEYAGHYNRPGDTAQIVQLGISKLRYPVLWEKHQPDESGKINWHWVSTQLETLRCHQVQPIVGLLHHGSGPPDTDLLDAAFPQKLAAYAEKVALRFPWLSLYTPVNEPLTTARFSGLYGYWHPHRTDEPGFIRMLLNQVKGIILSMQAIRKINPDAKLIQTEDLSKTHSTPLLKYQADFENQRRWLTYDLLCGKFNHTHFFWQYFSRAGIPEKDLAFFAEHTCPPEIMGFNYYVTSERWLDENKQDYPSHTYGGNGRHLYADTAAVHCGHMEGLEKLLTEAWQRYQLPLAVTECHINCSREEQMRWVKQTWDTCLDLHRKGITVKAVTAWALLGSFDWDSLLVNRQNHYETGAYDIRSGHLRPTILAKMIQSLARSGDFKHPLLSVGGWWEAGRDNDNMGSVQPLVIAGNGNMVHVLEKACIARSVSYVVTDNTDIGFIVDLYRPWAVIELMDDKHITCSGNLIIEHENHNPACIAAMTMDMLIDEERGSWHTSAGGKIRKISTGQVIQVEYIAE